ncbi:unnamed protein product [Effrenium voratum]|nr:unnamed protein product [Effrenium voratum]
MRRIWHFLLWPAHAQGNHRCWEGRFSYDLCCNESLPDGNPECWDGYRFTHGRCCLRPHEALPERPRRLKEGHSTRWRLVCDKDLGGWMIHELAFFEDANCTRRVRNHLRALESGHRGNFKPSHAFDLLADAADRFFWYSKAVSELSVAWLGVEVFRPVQVKCVELFHNNIPEVPVVLQRWQDPRGPWQPVQRWDALGGTWVYLVVTENESVEESRQEL